MTSLKAFSRKTRNTCTTRHLFETYIEHKYIASRQQLELCSAFTSKTIKKNNTPSMIVIDFELNLENRETFQHQEIHFVTALTINYLRYFDRGYILSHIRKLSKKLSIHTSIVKVNAEPTVFS